MFVGATIKAHDAVILCADTFVTAFNEDVIYFEFQTIKRAQVNVFQIVSVLVECNLETTTKQKKKKNIKL